MKLKEIRKEKNLTQKTIRNNILSVKSLIFLSTSKVCEKR